MAEIWFISGPPFDVAIWRAVEARVRDLGFTTRAWPCLMAGSGDIAEEVARLKADLEAAADDVLLVGHGSALPLIRAVGTHAKVSGLVLSNGPGETADRLSRLWTRVFSIPQPLRKSLLSPTVVMPFSVVSGAGADGGQPLRHGHDTVVAIVSRFNDSARRERVATYYQSLANLPELPLCTDKPCCC